MMLDLVSHVTKPRIMTLCMIDRPVVWNSNHDIHSDSSVVVLCIFEMSLSLVADTQKLSRYFANGDEIRILLIALLPKGGNF
jgi:hypothetical protein